MSHTEEITKLAASYVGLKHCRDNQNYQTRSNTKILMEAPYFNSDAYGIQPPKYNSTIDRNKFRKTSPNFLPSRLRST